MATIISILHIHRSVIQYANVLFAALINVKVFSLFCFKDIQVSHQSYII